MTTKNLALNSKRNQHLNEVLNVHVVETISNCLSRMSEEISDKITIAEVSNLYFNKIYDPNRIDKHSETISSLVKDIESIITEHHNDIVKEVVMRLSSLK
jgi:hypothetical protein